MKRTIGIVAALFALSLTAGPAPAQDGATAPQPAQPQATPQATPQPAATPPPATQPAPAAQPAVGSDAAAPAAENADPLAAIRELGKKGDPKADQKATAALDAVNTDVEKNVATDGDRKVAERLAAEFGSTPDALIAEKSDVKAGWGQLMIAHSLLANAAAPLTVKQLFDLRAEGMSWGQIGSGMGFRLGDVVRTAKEEARVAKGLAKADGKVAVMHPGSKSNASRPEAKAMAKSDPKATAPSETPDAGAGGSDKK